MALEPARQQSQVLDARGPLEFRRKPVVDGDPDEPVAHRPQTNVVKERRSLRVLRAASEAATVDKDYDGSGGGAAVGCSAN